MRRRFAFAFATTLVLASCTGGGPQPIPTLQPKRGGQVVFGAEQWPECLNPISMSAFHEPWTWYSVLEHVLPRAMQLNPKGSFVASPLLREGPSLENGGLSENPFTVRFHISDRAVWEDGSPITSADFAFTWRYILSTRGPHRTIGYDLIESVDATDPRTAVLTFRDVYMDWPDLFGGVFGFVLKKAAFTVVAQDGRPVNEMVDAIPFSGGPFLLKAWTRDKAILVRNGRYFAKVSLLDQITLIPKLDPLRELQALLTGEVEAIYPSPEIWSLINPIVVPPGVTARGSAGMMIEALWINQSQPPLDDRLVREALLYAVDREAVVKASAKPFDPDADALNCGLAAIPNLGALVR